MEEWSDVSVVNGALKALSREFGVERDRKSVLQIATLLIRLAKEGATDCDELISAARPHLVDLSATAVPELIQTPDAAV